MPDKNNNPTNEEFDKRVDDLVHELEEVSAKLSNQGDESSPSPPPSPEPEPEPEPEAAAPEPEPEAEPETVTESEPKTEPEAEAEAESEPQEPESSLDEQVEAMLEDAVAAEDEERVESESSEPAPAAMSADETIRAVEQVDETLADLADDLLDGDFDDAEDVLDGKLDEISPIPEPAPPAAAGEESDESSDDLLDGDFDDAEDVLSGEVELPEAPDPPPEPESPEPETAPESSEPESPDQDVIASEPESEHQPEPAAESSPPEPKPEPKPKSKRPPKAKAKRKKEKSPTDSKPELVALVRSAALGGAYSLAVAINKPFDTKPAYFKDIAGWLAAVTLFNAIAVWGFLLLVRGPAPGAADEKPVQLIGTSSADGPETPAIAESTAP